MPSRLNLHEELCSLLENKFAYFNPPESMKLHYPGIKYTLSGVDQKKADDINYSNKNRYEIIVMDLDADSDIFQKVLFHFPMCSFDRFYRADGINHWVLTLYY